ncbi:F-type H+-transporting ATPase subunit a [Hydrogenispora ethanolica]|jgi:F-type H+-transporting ATPase subunit a|uniref:ATP synthase subunit a n=1 Tax=Hydrogenispora ethanolica TaxID=1082276 RepID=A0A4R1RB83_HYDET|nr:F0F1 ATP synthase subunit A [Hydrogenispora ethanolica]TCL63025.1 F-type H+-transporting ATPase subunit a [Hydrogenispora ethanolica]
METNHADMVRWFGLDVNLRITEMTWIVMAALIIVAWLASRKINKIPKGWQNVMEMAVEFLEGLVKGGLGEAGVKYTYFFGSLFLFILVANMLGLVPHLSSPTKDVNVTLCLGVLWVIWLQYIGIRENGLANHLKHFLEPFPPFVIIHLFDLGIRPLTLALRLFGNIFAGEILLEKLTENFPVLVPSLWLFVSVAIGAIQAFIFTVLTVSYTGLTVSHEDNSTH